ncbi:hypothetical protein, partial [Burkholderia pseudomallei]|uniref:hypothetical protein n=1 Tax=Burkholderia pseudomallei TaxID=28450 RepID=UPI001C4D535E
MIDRGVPAARRVAGRAHLDVPHGAAVEQRDERLPERDHASRRATVKCAPPPAPAGRAAAAARRQRAQAAGRRRPAGARAANQLP